MEMGIQMQNKNVLALKHRAKFADLCLDGCNGDLPRKYFYVWENSIEWNDPSSCSCWCPGIPFVTGDNLLGAFELCIIPVCLGGYSFVMLFPYCTSSCALESLDLLLSYSVITVALHITIILIITHISTPKSTQPNFCCPGADNITKMYFDRGMFDQQNCCWNMKFYSGTPLFYANEIQHTCCFYKTPKFFDQIMSCYYPELCGERVRYIPAETYCWCCSVRANNCSNCYGLCGVATNEPNEGALRPVTGKSTFKFLYTVGI